MHGEGLALRTALYLVRTLIGGGPTGTQQVTTFEVVALFKEVNNTTSLEYRSSLKHTFTICRISGPLVNISPDREIQEERTKLITNSRVANRIKQATKEIRHKKN